VIITDKAKVASRATMKAFVAWSVARASGDARRTEGVLQARRKLGGCKMLRRWDSRCARVDGNARCSGAGEWALREFGDGERMMKVGAGSLSAWRW
jgi:hypothetical protein